jgi:two-component system OmpR family response regulator
VTVRNAERIVDSVTVDGAPRVVVVEDDRSLALALRVGLTHAGFDVVVVESGAAFAELVDQFRPDLALLDISLPGGPNGFELAAILRTRSDAPVLFVTASDALTDRLAGFDAGADDYVVKPFAMAELIARVRAVLRRAGRLRSAVVQVRELVVDDARRTVTLAGTPVHLTQTEFELLRALIRRPGRVLSKGQLLSLVWGFDEHDPNVVEVHISSLRRKLANDTTHLIHTIRGEGYVLGP